MADTPPVLSLTVSDASAAAATTEAGPTPSAPALLTPAPTAAAAAAGQLTASGTNTPIRAGTPLEHQVAGHAGVLEDESGDLVIKPALPREIAFYQLVQSAGRSTPLAALKPFLPKFYGTLQLYGRDDGNGIVAGGPGAGQEESVVLENLASPFMHPCVMDIKLGTVLHGPDATPEKAARMEKKARESTIGQKGMRMTGCKTWHAPSQSWIETPRSFGYAMTAARLPEGLVRFFPLPTDTLGFLTDDSAKASAAHPDTYDAHSMPARLTYRVLQQLDEHVARLEAALQQLEMRAVGASLLVVYEGDPARLGDAFERFDAKRVALAARNMGQTGNAARARPDRDGELYAYGDEAGGDSDSDSDDDCSEFDDDDDNSNSESESESGTDDDDLDGPKADAKRLARAPPLSVRLIDFAHTWMVARGEGPDQGVLFGIRTVRHLIAQRMDEVREWMDKYEPESPSKVSVGFGGGGGVPVGAAADEAVFDAAAAAAAAAAATAADVGAAPATAAATA